MQLMKFLKYIFFSLITTILSAQETNYLSQIISINQNIDGILLTPKIDNPPLVILLSGSGPIDRDGNSNLVKGNMLKKLAESLSNNGIATYRYDKRSFKQIKERNFDENMKFDAFIEDAATTVSYFKSKNNFKSVYILGHSQGSLVGILASKSMADGFISVAGAARTIDKIITDQVIASAPIFGPETKRIFEILKTGETTEDYPPALASIFNKSVQPFMMSWMKFNPLEEIKKLEIPVLILNGNNDIQIPETEAKLLHEAIPSSNLKIIEGMNHALVTYEGSDKLGNAKSYNEIQRPLNKELINTIVAFIK